jgi:hypothetical protein
VPWFFFAFVPSNREERALCFFPGGNALPHGKRAIILLLDEEYQGKDGLVRYRWLAPFT